MKASLKINTFILKGFDRNIKILEIIELHFLLPQNYLLIKLILYNKALLKILTTPIQNSQFVAVSQETAMISSAVAMDTQ